MLHHLHDATYRFHRTAMLKQIIDPKLVKSVIELIDINDRIVVTCHKSPDGDAIGSSLALTLILKALEKMPVLSHQTGHQKALTPYRQFIQ